MLLLAPKSGCETRQSLKDFVVEADEKTKELVEQQRKR
jgi:gas vesicle protein